MTRCKTPTHHLAEITRDYFRQINELRNLVQSRPDAIDWEQQLTSLLRFNAESNLSIGRPIDSEGMVLESIQRLRTITKFRPTDYSWANGLVSALKEGAEISYFNSDKETSLLRSKEALQLFENMPKDEHSAETKRRRAELYFLVGRYRDDNEGDAMMHTAIESLRILSDIYSSKPDKNNLLKKINNTYANALLTMAQRNIKRNKKREATPLLIKAKSLIPPLIGDDETVYRRAMLAKIHFLSGDAAEAENIAKKLIRLGYARPDFVEAMQLANDHTEIDH